MESISSGKLKRKMLHHAFIIISVHRQVKRKRRLVVIFNSHSVYNSPVIYSSNIVNILHFLWEGGS
jgi:hypothetical protein